MTLVESLQTKKFLITVELVPPKGPSVDNILTQAVALSSGVDAFNIPDNPGGNLHASPLGVAHRLQEKGIESIYQITCRDRNRLGLLSDLLAAATLDIHNVLVVSGDHPVFGDHPEAKPVYDLDSVHLLQLLAQLNRGYLDNGRPLNGRTNFCYGAVANPNDGTQNMQVWKVRSKVAQGCSFIQTQAVFDVEAFKNFRQEISDLPVKVLAGVLPLRSSKMAHWLNARVPGIKIPEPIVARLEKSKNPAQEGWKIAEEIVGEIRGMCDGIHLMPLGNVDQAQRFLAPIVDSR
ncbi:MAG: methylenetetrahydrofolate reductase [Desulfitobacteriaceae bacterium]|nr:methylenetetrahydrofolate reductase [Desulfitobacteriaceae bacterium]MDI6915609.1 methylenetetrahydrofolate reductase [Desulfitobacteriaceae bacterium]